MIRSRGAPRESSSGVMAAAVNGNEDAGLDIRRLPNGGFHDRLIDGNKLVLVRRDYARSEIEQFTMLGGENVCNSTFPLFAKRAVLDDAENHRQTRRALNFSMKSKCCRLIVHTACSIKDESGDRKLLIDEKLKTFCTKKLSFI